MPNSYNPWGWDEWDDEAQFWDDDPYADSLSIWKPNDPDPRFSPTLDERREYRSALDVLARDLSKHNLGSSAFAEGASGFGATYRPARLGWNAWGDYEPKSRIGLGVWGYDRPGVKQSFPELGGAIVTPTIDIFAKDREARHDDYGRPLESSEYMVSSGLTSGRAFVGEAMRIAGEAGRARLDELIANGEPLDKARTEAERIAREAVRTQMSGFPRADFGERWSWPNALREAMAGSASIRIHGKYGINNRELFEQLGQYGYFTRNTSPSEDPYHPERGAWQAYSLDSLYALGWLPTADGGFITGTNKPTKRRQLGVQRLAAPVGADDMMRTGRLTGDKMLATTAVFLNNYPYSEGSGVADPSLVQGFRDYRPRTVERPLRALENWAARFFTGRDARPDVPVGEDVPIGEQFLNEEWQPLQPVRGIRGVAQRLFGHRSTVSGYQALMERDYPFESGTVKLMHYGMKALMFLSDPIIKGMQDQVAAAQAAGTLPRDVQKPRMVLPMPKDWMQAEYGMFDVLPEETLRGMGISDQLIKSKRWQDAAPEVIDKIKAYADQRKFTFRQAYEVPVERLGAFLEAGNVVGGEKSVEYLTKGKGKYERQFARFTAEHTGYALPIAAGFRLEYPGKSPMYSPEELMQLQRLYPDVAKRLAKGNAMSRIWGAAVANAEGITPKDALGWEELPWVSARLGLDDKFDTEGTARTLIEGLAREMRDAGNHRNAIVGPGGAILPNPNDVLGKSILGLSGQEQSQFVSSYVQAMKLMATGEDATEAVKAFSKTLDTFASGHNVRREALGARLDRAVEGTFTSHLAIPDDTVVVGDLALRSLLGIRADDKYGDDKLAEAVRMIEKGEDFFALGTRRPVSDMFNQLGVPIKIITEKMAREMYDVPIERLGRSFAVSPTLAAVWRGDVDADRALLHAVTDVVAKPWMHQPAGEKEPIPWFLEGISFHTSKDVRKAFESKTMMAGQVEALRTHAPDAYASWLGDQKKGVQKLVEAGLAGDTSTAATVALSRALHGIKIDWNESAKWSEELAPNISKNAPQSFAYYSDPANGTVFTRQEMMNRFQQDAKSKTLMGRAYNRYLRGLTALAGNDRELQAAVTLASNIYQKALDNKEMTKGELMLFNMMESLGPSGAMYDKFFKEQGYVRASHAGGAAGMVGMLADAIIDVDAPLEVRQLLFSRDPEIAAAVALGSPRKIIAAIAKQGGEVKGSKSFLEDPSRAGILPQLVQSLHFSKDRMSEVNLNDAERAYAAQGQQIRSMVRVLGRGQEGGLAPTDAIGDIRNMVGLDSLGWWRGVVAERMGLPGQFFASEEDVLAGLPSFANPALPGDEFAASISRPEADVLEGLRQMPPSQAQQIAAMISRPARYTPRGGMPSFATGPAGWDKLTREQQVEIVKMRRHGATDADLAAKVAEWTATAGTGSDPGPDPFNASAGQGGAGAPPPPPPPSQGATSGSVGRGSIAHEVYQEFGGYDAFQAAIESIWTAKENRGSGDPLIPSDRLTRRAVNEIAKRGGGEEAMQEWQNIMGRHGVGFQRQMEQGPNGPEPVWSHLYGNRPTGQAFAAAAAAEENPELNPAGQVMAAMKTLAEKAEMNVTDAPWMIPVINQLLPLGMQSELFVRGYPGGNYSMRMKFLPQGLQGAAADLLTNLVQKGLTEGNTPEVSQMMGDAYKAPGIGQDMVRAVRTLMGANPQAMDLQGLWRSWESLQKVSGALGGDAPEALLNKGDAIEAAMNELGDFALGELGNVNKGQAFDYEGMWLKDSRLAKAMRTFGQRLDPRDVAAMSREERRTYYNKQRDAMATIRDQMGRLGVAELGDEFNTIQKDYAAYGDAAFTSLSPDLRFSGQHYLIDEVLGGAEINPHNLAMQLSGDYINTGQFRALGDLPATMRQLAALPDTEANLAQRYKLETQRQNQLLTLSGMVDKASPNDKLTQAIVDSEKTTRELGGRLEDLTKVEHQRVEQEKVRAGDLAEGIQTDPRYQAGMAWAAGIPLQRLNGANLSSADKQRLQALRNLQEGAGLGTGFIDELLGGTARDTLLTVAGGEEAAGRPAGGRRGLVNRLLRREEGAPELGTGAIENMFTELTLGWTAFRARMAWNLTTGAQKGWMQDFLGQENSAIGAALAGGSMPGTAGPTSQYISSQAAMANARAQLGQGVAQVYAPLMSSLGDVGAAPGLGSLATLTGTPVGAGFVTAMGVNMLAKGLGSAALGGLVAPLGMAAMAGTGAVLTNAYLRGEAPEWMRYENDTYSQNWRKGAREGELAGERPGGFPEWFGRALGAAAGAIGVDPASMYKQDLLGQVEQEKATWHPGTLAYDTDKLRGWVQANYKNRVPVDAALQMMGSLFQITGRTAEEVYSGKAPEFKKLMDQYVGYMEGGASPGELFTSQMTALGAAGVPLGPQAEAWMNQFTSRIPGQQRKQYEEAFQGLAGLARATGRPVSFDEAQRAVQLADQYGSMERGVNMVTSGAGVGWFTSAFGMQPESANAKLVGSWMSFMPFAQQDAAQRIAGMTSQSFARLGINPLAAAGMVTNLAQNNGDNVLGVSNLVVQAESVSLQTGKDFFSLYNDALSQGYAGRSVADQRWYLASQVGVAGLAPNAYLQGGAQATAFEQGFANLSADSRQAFTTASGILNSIYPGGYTESQLYQAANMLSGGMTIPSVQMGFAAAAGKAGLAGQFGVLPGSPMAQALETSVLGPIGSPSMSLNQAQGFGGLINSRYFSHMTGQQIAQMAPSLRGAFNDVWAGKMSLYDFDRAQQVATKSTPWGYSASLGFGPGSLTDSLGRPYGMYETWTASNGGTYAPLFDLQQSAGYANLAYSSAANKIQHRQFLRQQQMQRLEWGSGPFQTTQAVQAAIFPTDGSEGADVGAGMQVGQSQIGLAQQEAAIRRQMWQESIAAQQQSIQFAKQGLEISRQELALSKQTYQAQREYQIGEREANRGMQLRQREWSAQDFGIRVERMGITQQWQMEDLQRARRYASGRERVEIERNIQRTMLTQSWDRDDTQRQRSREKELQRFQDERYDAAVRNEERLHSLQMQRFALQEDRLNLQAEQLAAQEANLLRQAGLQEELQKIEDARFKAQYEQTQAQMKDDEELEKLRQQARNAEMAYEAARLANAQTIKDAEEKFAQNLQGIKEGSVLDKWIEFFNAIRGGPPTGGGSNSGGDGDKGGNSGEQEDVDGPRAPIRLPQPEVSTAMRGSATSAAAQPVVVNFVLDGETVMQAVVTPERLRPVVQEVSRRERWR